MSTPSQNWHADPAALGAYAEGSVNPAVAWAVEAHLPVCAECRDVLSHLIAAADAALLQRMRSDMVLPRVKRRATARRAVLEGVFGPWWAWLLLVVTSVVALWAVGHMPEGPTQRAHGLTWGLALSPLVPVAMVGVIYAFADRDVATSATPRGGWELLLIRTAAVLGVAAPVVMASLWVSDAGVVSWLLPGLGLCLGSLLLGSWMGVERASVALSGGWALVVALTMQPSSQFVDTLAPALNAHGQGAAAWLTLIAIGGATLLWRRDRFEIPGGLR